MILVPSYNQLKFSPNASWNPNAITFADSTIVGLAPRGIYIDTNNTIYVADRTNNRIQIWLNGSTIPTKTISGNLSTPSLVFVTSTGDIYISDNNMNPKVEQWSLDANRSTAVMYTNLSCHGIFVDTSNTIYCSMMSLHQVVKRWLNDNSTTWSTVAGTGIAGNAANMLNSPRRIFVDTNLDLYVADFENHRIQLFRLGQSNGITVAGNGSGNFTITLNYPTAVILDADKYLFIADGWNNRIVGSGPYGFRCIVGCSLLNGSTPDRLSSPASLSFDSYGNLYVLDLNNNRLQKFLMKQNASSKCTKHILNRLSALYYSNAVTDFHLEKSRCISTNTSRFH